VPQETDAEKIARLEREIEQLKQEDERLRRALDEAQRAAKRQAAPFSRRGPKANPQKPGRKKSACYGRKGHRAVPPTVDQTLEAELPPKCPHCGGAITENDVFDQYQSEIPEPRVERIRFRVHLGCCQQCGQPVQGRHPRQTSDASGAAASQLGPRAVALATQLNKGLGLPYGKTSAVLKQAFEQAIRPAVVARKVWGGNRTPRGAHTQEVLVSLPATCRQQHHSAQTVLIGLLCSPEPRRIRVWDAQHGWRDLPVPQVIRAR